MPADYMRPIAVTIKQACNLIGIKPTLMYELLGAGELESALIGGRRLIVYTSLEKLLERSKSDPASFSMGANDAKE